MKALIAGAAVITGLVASFLPISDATAQAYRCGRVYQDHPCDGNLSAKSVSGSSHRSGSTNSNGAPIHPICQQRGEDSLKIIWAREAGATREKVMADESNAANSKLVADVYRVRGSAQDVRARIEVECKAEMDERAKALAIHEAMVKAGVAGSGSAAPSGPSAAEVAAQRATAAQQTEDAERRADARETARRCDRIRQELNFNRTEQRSGGRTKDMERLNRTQSTLEREMRDGGC